MNDALAREIVRLAGDIRGADEAVTVLRTIAGRCACCPPADLAAVAMLTVVETLGDLVATLADEAEERDAADDDDD